MDVIASLPATEGAELTDVIAHWLTPNNLPYTAAPHKIIETLAQAGLVEPALRVVLALFQVFEHEGRLTALFDYTMYEHYLNQAAGELAKVGPLDALPVFCDLLQQASRIDGRFTGLDATDHTYFSVESLATDELASQDILV
jgi:hypothetical protein